MLGAAVLIALIAGAVALMWRGFGLKPLKPVDRAQDSQLG